MLKSWRVAFLNEKAIKGRALWVYLLGFRYNDHQDESRRRQKSDRQMLENYGKAERRRTDYIAATKAGNATEVLPSMS